MSRNMTREELAAMLSRNPGLKVAVEPLERRVVPTAGGTIPPPISTATLKTPQNSSNGIHELMATPSYQGSLQPEESLSVAVATELRRLTHAGKLRAVWSRIPGEHPEGGRYGMLAQVKRTAMGHIPGIPDLGFWWGTGSGLIELKTESQQGSLLAPSGKAGLRKGRRTYLRGRQRLVQVWADGLGVKHATCRSVVEVVAVLKQWGVLDG